MSRQQSTGVIAVKYVPTIANISAPTLAEISAGVDLTPFLTRDGLSTPLEGETIDTSDASNRHNSRGAGNYGGQPLVLKCHRDSSGSDTAWSTLVRNTVGHIVVRRFGGSGTAFAAAQKVDVYPIEVITRSMMDIADNESQKFSAQCAVTSAPAESVAVAA